MATPKDQTYNSQEEFQEEFLEESMEVTTKAQLPILLVEEPEEVWAIMVIFKLVEATHQTSKVEISDHHTREEITTM